MTGIGALKGLGLASHAAPAPKVFTSAKGLETFSTRFVLEWRDNEGVTHSRELDRDVYGRFLGPYNRRNVYGALLAYGPVLLSDPRTTPMAEAMIAKAAGGHAPLLRELGLDPETMHGLSLRFVPRGGTMPDGLPERVVLRAE